MPRRDGTDPVGPAAVNTDNKACLVANRFTGWTDKGFAHGNSLRALVKYLEGISDYNITGLNIPTGLPLMYELGKDLKPINKRYLGDEETAKKQRYR